MFFDTSPSERFLINRVSSARKSLRRVLIVSEDSSITICKLNGVVTRLFHVNSITHLIHSPDNGLSASVVLIRVRNEHDVLFAHAGLGDGGASRPLRFIECVEELRRASFGTTPLNVVERNDPQLLHDAANLAKSEFFARPSVCIGTSQVLVPILFDDFPIPQPPELSVISEETDLFVDSSFITMLLRAMELHPHSSSTQPLVRVDAPEPFPSLEVSARFLSGFSRAYERELPLVMTLHSYLPYITTFRASRRFWDFAQRLLRVSRPSANVLATLSDSHIEICPISEQDRPLCATLVEWNATIVQWEVSVRSPSTRSSASATKGAMSAAVSDVFWRSFVAELESLAALEKY